MTTIFFPVAGLTAALGPGHVAGGLLVAATAAANGVLPVAAALFTVAALTVLAVELLELPELDPHAATPAASTSAAADASDR
jgi:hypothetical protein